MRIFEVYAESHPAVRNQRVVDLCLVNKYWDAVANRTPRLWTRINLSFPFARDHLAAMRKRVRASKLEKIDVSIDFRDPVRPGNLFGSKTSWPCWEVQRDAPILGVDLHVEGEFHLRYA